MASSSSSCQSVPILASSAICTFARPLGNARPRRADDQILTPGRRGATGPGPSVLDRFPDPPRDHRRILSDVVRHHQAAGEADPARAHSRRGPGVERLRGLVRGDRLHVRGGRLRIRSQAANAATLVPWLCGDGAVRRHYQYQCYEVCVAMTGCTRGTSSGDPSGSVVQLERAVSGSRGTEATSSRIRLLPPDTFSDHCSLPRPVYKRTPFLGKQLRLVPPWPTTSPSAGNRYRILLR